MTHKTKPKKTITQNAQRGGTMQSAETSRMLAEIYSESALSTSVDTSFWRAGDLFSYTYVTPECILCTLLFIDSDTLGKTVAKFGFGNAKTCWVVTETQLNYFTRVTKDDGADRVGSPLDGDPRPEQDQEALP